VTDQGQHKQLYQIGTVAALTGLSTHKIRMWEKRYGLVTPDRSQSRNRLYSQYDLERLKLIKILVDSGHAVSRLAALDKLALQNLLSQQERWVSSASAPALAYERAVIVSDFLQISDLAGLAQSFPGKISLWTHQQAQHFIGQDDSELSEAKLEATILLIDQPSLHRDDALEWLQRIRSHQCPLAILIYQYSDRDTLKAFTSRVSRAVKGPMTSDLLEREMLVICSHYSPVFSVAVQSAENAPQRFSRQQLLRFAQMTSSSNCECPQHLATLLMDLINFEQYSSECENKNLADKAMHEYLFRLAGSVRGQLEEALEKLAEMEKIPL